MKLDRQFLLIALQLGEVVDVTGTSKGKGYQGVIKRHGQHIGPKGHGSGAHRIVGSMGPIAPNRIAPGKNLPGQMGGNTRTVQNLEIVAVDVEKKFTMILLVFVDKIAFLA